MLLPGTIYSQDCGCIDCPVAIEDQSISKATFVVEGADNNSLTTNEVQTVFLKFKHSYPSELQMRLISPAGQAVTLIGPQGTAASAIFFGGFNVSFVANVANTDPDPGMSSIWNNADLSGINQYNGAYLPHSGSLQNFNTGSVNGDWLLEITDPLQFDFGELEELNIQFKDQAGIDCCEADAGDMEEPDIVACPGAENLLLDITPSFIGSAPNSALYGYTYLISQNDLLIEVDDQPDLRFTSPGTYQIYGLSYELLDLPLLPIPNGSLSITSIQNLLNLGNPLLCADLTESFFEVTILAGDTETMLGDTICQGDTLLFGGDKLFETGVYRDTFPLSESCDSIVILDLLVAQLDFTQLTAQTCEPDLVGLDTMFLTNQFSCDSLVVTETSILLNDTIFFQEQTCDPLLAGQIDTLVVSTPECDSVFITYLFYKVPDTSFVFVKSCLPNEVGIDTIPFASGGQCDDIQIVQTDLYLIDTTFFEGITCDQNMQDSIIEFFPTDTCDRVEVTNFIYVLPDTTYLTLTTCFANAAGLDTLVLSNSSGCDSLIISDILFADSDTLRLEQFSCELEDVGMDTTFLKNVNNCDSLVILTTLFSSADTTYIQEFTCDINQTEPTEQSFSTETCDSIVVTNYSYSAPDTTLLSIMSCEESQIPDTTILQNQFFCDSLVIKTFVYGGSDPVEISENTCDPNQVGVFSDTLSGAFCDSIVITTFSLTMSDTTRTDEFVCSEEEARIDTMLLSNEEGCDSIILTTYIWQPIEPTIISVFTCDAAQVGLDTTVLTSANRCDSLIINDFIFSNSDTTYLPIAFTCNPDEADIDTTLFTTATCDSIVISTTIFSEIDTTFLSERSCDVITQTLDTFVIVTTQGCDSVIITSIQPLVSTQSFTEIPVFDPNEVGLDTLILTNVEGCDSLVITSFFLDITTSDTTFVNMTTCDPNVMIDTTNISGESVVITIPILELIDTTFIQEITCDAEQAVLEVSNLLTSEGCDSVVVVTYDYILVDTIYNVVLTCIDMEQDTFVSVSGDCPSLEIYTYINQGADTSFLDNVSCEGPFGLDTMTLQNIAGCDSLVITNTIEASSSETNIFVNTCLPDLTNDTITLSGQFCDSIVITNYTNEAIPPTIISVNTCDENDLAPDTLTLTTVAGCDSLIITVKIHTPIEIMEITQTTCEESLIGVIVDTLSSQFGCDSLIQTTYIQDVFQADFNLNIEPPSCNGFADAQAYILSTDEISVLWLIDGSESLTRDDLSAGDYMVQLQQGVCDSTILITVPEGLALQVELEVTYRPCSTIGGNIAVIPLSGSGPYDFIWEDGSEDSLRIDLADETYTVTVTDDLSCTNAISAEINNVTGLDVETDIEHVSCFGYEDGSITITLLSGTAPYTEMWSDGGASLFRDSLPAGNYSVTISDVNDCNVTLNRAVQEPPILTLDVEVTEEEGIVVTATGGTPPYTYLWIDGTTTDRIENPIADTEYEVTVTDANDCMAVIGELFQTDAVQVLDSKNVDVFPNPTSSVLNLSASDGLHVLDVVLYDIHGRKVLSQTSTDQNSKTSFSVSNLASGTYILEANFAEGIYRQKVLILRE